MSESAGTSFTTHSDAHSKEQDREELLYAKKLPHEPLQETLTFVACPPSLEWKEGKPRHLKVFGK